VREVAKANGLVPPTNSEQDPAVLAMKVQSLEKAMAHLTGAMQQNAQHLVHAFEMTDMHIHVLERVCNDVAQGVVRWFPVHEEDNRFLSLNPPFEVECARGWQRVEGAMVHLSWYQWQYYQMKQLMGFLGIMRQMGIWLAPKRESATVVEEPEEDTEYFGGDG
jgi:hypothetical protein